MIATLFAQKELLAPDIYHLYMNYYKFASNNNSNSQVRVQSDKYV